MGAYDRHIRVRGQPRDELDADGYAAAVTALLLALLREETADKTDPPQIDEAS